MSTAIPTLAQSLATCQHLELSEKNRIICKLTGHEMPARADVVHKYITGDKFKKALEWYSYDFSQYLPYIIEHDNKEKGKNKLFCTLTKQVLNRIPAEIVKHTNGKRFKRLKEEFENKAKAKKSKEESIEELWMPSGNLLSGGDEDENDEPREDDSMSDLIGSDHNSLDDENDDDDNEDEDDDDEIISRRKTADKKKPTTIQVPACRRRANSTTKTKEEKIQPARKRGREEQGVAAPQTESRSKGSSKQSTQKEKQRRKVDS